MDPSVLEVDEIEVECAVRGIEGDTPDTLQLLDDAIQKEISDPQIIPAEMHVTAKKRPDLEIRTCHSKLQVLKKQITLLIEQEEEQAWNLAHQIESRLLHVANRLQRATKSPTYQESARNTLKTCEQLRSSLQIFLTNKAQLNKSIEAAKIVEMELHDNLLSIVSGSPNLASKQSEKNSDNEPGSSKSRLLVKQSTLEELLEQVQAEGLVKNQQAENQTKLLESVLEKFSVLSQQMSTLNKRQEELQSQMNHEKLGINPPEMPVISGGYLPGPPAASGASVDPTSIQFNRPSQQSCNPAAMMSNTVFTPAAFTNPSIATITDPLLTIPANIHTIPSSSMFPQLRPTSYVPAVSAALGSAHTNYHSAIPQTNPVVTFAQNVPSTRGPSDYRSLARCGLSFDGSSSSTPIDMFVFQLETVARSLNLSEETLLTEMSSVLKGVAWQWYWTCRRHNPAICWMEIKQQFMERFQDRRSDFEIRRIIETRRQLPRETFVEFYHQVWSMTLQCKTPYSEEKIIEILMQNMRGGLQYQLTDRTFKSINELIASCTAWEDTWNRLRIDPESVLYHKRGINELNFIEPSERSVTTQEQNYCTLPPVGEQLDAFQSGTVGQSKPWASSRMHPPNTNFPRPVISRELICYNCDEKGHTFNDCHYAPIRWFCHRCGMKDTVFAKCPKCSENIPRGQWRIGNHGTPKVVVPNQSRQELFQTEEAASNTDPELRILARQNSSSQTR